MFNLTGSRTADLLQLDPQSPLPLHVQAEESLRRLIQRPEYRNGGMLPDEVSLANALGVSRNTLRAAIGRLVAEGRLERKAGVGTQVTKPRIQSGVNAWHSFTHEMEAKGIRVQTYHTHARWAPPSITVARELKISRQSNVLCLARVRGWDGQPAAEFQSFFHPRLGLTGEDDFTKPLYNLIQEQSGVIADRSLEELTAVAADSRLAELLKVKVGTPLLRRERTVLDTRRRPMEFAIVHYRCDRFQLTLDLCHRPRV